MLPGNSETLGVALNFFWWVCAAWVFKSRVYGTDFFLTNRSWEQIFAKISVFGAEILQKLEQNGPNNDYFFEGGTEGIRTDTRCKKVGLCSGGGA